MDLLIILWLWPRVGQSILFIPAPLVNLSYAQTSFLSDSFTLRVTPGWILLELLLQINLLLVIFLSASFRFFFLWIILRWLLWQLWSTEVDCSLWCHWIINSLVFLLIIFNRLPSLFNFLRILLGSLVLVHQLFSTTWMNIFIGWVTNILLLLRINWLIIFLFKNNLILRSLCLWFTLKILNNVFSWKLILELFFVFILIVFFFWLGSGWIGNFCRVLFL